MLSSNSSGFEKDLANTRAYDFQESVGGAAVELVQAIDEFDLEQSCLIRLKSQREKIEELTRLYLQKEKELAQRSEHEKKLQEEIEKLSDLTEYKKSFAELKRDHDSLLKKEMISAEESDYMKKEFEETISIAKENEQVYKAEIKHQKQQRLLAESNWEEIVADKEEQLRKQSRRAQEKEVELEEKINRIEEQLQTIYGSMEEKGTELESTSFKLRGQLKVRDEEITNYDKLVECMRKQLSDFKTKMIGSSDEWEREKEELCEVIDQLKIQVKLLRREDAVKENELYEVKEMIRRCDSKNINLQDTVSSLKLSLKKTKDSMDSSIAQLTNSSEDEKVKLELMVQEFKNELEVQMEEKGTLALQLRRMKGSMDRRDHQEKQRKLLLMSEFREIDKLERVIKRII